MDFEMLATILPKPSPTWTVSDTLKWVEFTGLTAFGPKFQTLGIDGSCLYSLTEQDFREELGITSKIMLKKIMTWINRGFKQYDCFLKESRMAVTIRPPPKHNQLLINKSPEQSIAPKQPKKTKTISVSKEEPEQDQLIIKQCEVPQANFYSFKNKGGVMGRNTGNQIPINDECVSRFHAEIIYDDGNYYIKDCGSSSGTFLRITEKKKLVDGVILEMGSNQFEVSMSDIHLTALKVVEGTNLGFVFSLPKKDKITIGRKPHNEISFPDDHHLSNQHATFFSIDGVWYVEDLGSTNGSWIRLSEEGKKSGCWKLQDRAQFKLSTNLTYECRRDNENRKTEKQKTNQKCIFCKQADQNAIILPCKHNTACYGCVSELQLSQCPSCGAAITDVIKIFKV